MREWATRSASKLTAGGFRPSGEATESWLGRVFLYAPNEPIPQDSAGDHLLPLAQIYLPGLPFIPDCLKGIQVLTAFIGHELPAHFEPMGERWLVREYPDLSALERKEVPAEDSFLRPFPVSSELIEADWPHWDGGGLDEEVSNAILLMEESEEIEDYYDIADHEYGHKVGGYPSFCQSGIDPGAGFEFAFQISSDPKINLNVIDNGSLQFYRNPSTRQWRIYHDFY